MTNEEAIKELKYSYNENITDNEAIDMAIKALEQKPCEDCISRRAVDTLVDELARAISDERCCISRGRSTGEIMQDILHLSSVTPQPKTGHWIAIDEEPHEDYECDKCGYTVSTFTANIAPYEEYKYCPSCGARMVEPQAESEEE